MSELRKPLPKNKQNQCENAACEPKTSSEKNEYLFKHRFLTLP